MTTGPDHDPRINEQLSAWLDDELPEVQRDFFIARLVQSPGEAARLARYGLIRSCLRDTPGVVAGKISNEAAALQLTGRVRAALGAPGSGTQPPAILRKSSALYYAMAAGLALVAVLVAVVQAPRLRPGDEQLPTSAQMVLPPPATVRQAPLSVQRMTNYLVHHGEYSGHLSARVTESHIINSRPNFVVLQANDGPPSR